MARKKARERKEEESWALKARERERGLDSFPEKKEEREKAKTTAKWRGKSRRRLLRAFGLLSKTRNPGQEKREP